MRKVCLLFWVALFVGATVFCIPMQAEAENLTADLRFLGYCDEEELAVWDNEIALLETYEASEMKSYLENNIIKSWMDDYEKARGIYDWIYANVKYADESDPIAYLEPYDVFKYKVAVCGGYSNLYKAMLNLVDIPSVLISGMTPYGAHVWNAVCVNGRWFYSDATWGGDYFDKGADAFVQDHHAQRVEKVSALADGNILIGYDDSMGSGSGVAVVGVKNKSTTVTIPDKFEEFSITSISYQLFNDAYGVKVINVGEGIADIAQVYSNTLEAINVSEYNSVYASKDGVLFSKDMSRIWNYPIAKKDESFTLPKEIKDIDFKETFKSQYLVDLEVEEGNKEFSSYKGALYNADQTELLVVPLGKTEIYVPETAKIGDMAFVNADTSKISIFGKKDSPAYMYAVNNNIRFVEITEEKPEEKKDVTEVFVDVVEGAWYVDSVQYVYKQGIIVGDGSVFAPNDATTRAMVAVILYRLAGSPTVTDFSVYNKFADLPKKHLWYSDAVAWALKEGVSTGDDVNMKYNPSSPVTREQLALFLWRYAEYTGEDVTVTKTEKELFGETFVNEWAKEGFGWAVENGVIKGAEEKDGVGNIYYVLNPQGGATRAQFAKVLHRFYEGEQ